MLDIVMFRSRRFGLWRPTMIRPVQHSAVPFSCNKFIMPSFITHATLTCFLTQFKKREEWILRLNWKRQMFYIWK